MAGDVLRCYCQEVIIVSIASDLLQLLRPILLRNQLRIERMVQ
jgi:hypothetical protein